MKSQLVTSRNQQGMTLFEVIVGVTILGLMSLWMSPIFSSYVSSQKLAYVEKQKRINQQVTSAFYSYATSSSNGVLPTPYTGGGRTNAIYNPSSSTALGLALTAALNQTAINVNEINDDGYASQRVRVYQMVGGLTQTVPLYLQSGPTVTLTYQYGVVYQTDCPFSNATCNPTAASTVPGVSAAMTTSNYSTWTATGSDIGASFVSTLLLQKQNLILTAQRVDKIRDSFVSYMVTKQRQAAATDTTNWYPTESISAAGATPATNQGCRDGWYNLELAPNILPTIGLSAAEYGVTAWGGAISYCRDYDPIGTKVPDAPPHYGAIRFNKNVSAAIAPDGSVAANNVVLTFGN